MQVCEYVRKDVPTPTHKTHFRVFEYRQHLEDFAPLRLPTTRRTARRRFVRRLGPRSFLDWTNADKFLVEQKIVEDFQDASEEEGHIYP
jgi:hypothetical protein